MFCIQAERHYTPTQTQSTEEKGFSSSSKGGGWRARRQVYACLCIVSSPPHSFLLLCHAHTHRGDEIRFIHSIYARTNLLLAVVLAAQVAARGDLLGGAGRGGEDQAGEREEERGEANARRLDGMLHDASFGSLCRAGEGKGGEGGGLCVVVCGWVDESWGEEGQASFLPCIGRRQCTRFGLVGWGWLALVRWLSWERGGGRAPALVELRALSKAGFHTRRRGDFTKTPSASSDPPTHPPCPPPQQAVAVVHAGGVPGAAARPGGRRLGGAAVRKGKTTRNKTQNRLPSSSLTPTIHNPPIHTHPTWALVRGPSASKAAGAASGRGTAVAHASPPTAPLPHQTPHSRHLLRPSLHTHPPTHPQQRKQARATMAGAPPPNPVTIEEGWEREILPKAIQPLEKILNEGLQDRQKRDLFGPKEYVHIYT